jgi:hypothetical protein
VLRKRASRLCGRRIRTRAWHQHLGFLFSIIALPSKRESRGRAISVPDYCQTQAVGEEVVERRRAETSTTADSASAGATRPRFLCLAHTVEKFRN